MGKVQPSRIRLEASSFCQLRCPTCSTTERRIDAVIGKGFLRFEDFRRLIDLNPSIKLIELSNYGEVFLNPHLLRILEYAHRKGVLLTLANGVNLNTATDETLEGLVKYSVSTVNCSIDGASPETYRKYRVRGDFTTVITNIERINYYKQVYRSEFPRLDWQFIVFGHNEHEIPIAREMARKLGMTFRTKISWDANISPIRDPEFVRVETGEAAVTREDYERIHGEPYLKVICHQLWVEPQINWDGKVLGCCVNYWGDFGGNAFKDGLVKSLNNEKIAYARDMLLGEKPAQNDIPCSTCKFYYWMRDHSRWVTRNSLRSHAMHLLALHRTAGRPTSA
jgi:MoaA/NifB/PqqE/SkfB family radical SAM enzyme